MFISNDAMEESPEKEKKKKKKKKKKAETAGSTPAALVTPQAAEVLKRVDGNLGRQLADCWAGTVLEDLEHLCFTT